MDYAPKREAFVRDLLSAGQDLVRQDRIPEAENLLRTARDLDADRISIDHARNILTLTPRHAPAAVEPSDDLLAFMDTFRE